jgi:nitrous oxidase accessory protein
VGFSWSVAPSRNLQALVDAAAPGSTLHLPPIEYAGPIVVAKPLRILADPGSVLLYAPAAGQQGSALSLVADGISVSGLAVRVSSGDSRRLDAAIYVRGRRIRIEGCSISGPLFGIRFDRCEDSLAERCEISGAAGRPFAERGDGVRITGGTRIAVLDSSIAFACDGVYLDDTALPRIEGCSVSGGRYGVHVMYGSGARIEGCNFDRMVAGAMVMGTDGASLEGCSIREARDPRGSGVILFQSSSCRILRNEILSCQTGLALTEARLCTIEGNLLEGNARGIELNGGCAESRVSGNSFVGNGVQVDGPESAADLMWSEGRRGNYWDDYRGYDWGGDGVASVPYRRPRSFVALKARQELAAIFFSSPLQRAVDNLDLRGEVVDPYPLSRPPCAGVMIGASQSEGQSPAAKGAAIRPITVESCCTP